MTDAYNANKSNDKVFYPYDLSNRIYDDSNGNGVDSAFTIALDKTPALSLTRDGKRINHTMRYTTGDIPWAEDRMNYRAHIIFSVDVTPSASFRLLSDKLKKQACVISVHPSPSNNRSVFCR